MGKKKKPTQQVQEGAPNEGSHVVSAQESRGQPGEGHVQPGQGRGQPGQGRGQPGQGRGQPGQGRGQQGQGRGQPGEGRGQPGQGRGQPSEGHGQPGQGRGRQGRGQHGEGHGQPGQGRGQSGQGRGQPSEGHGQPGQGRGQHGEGHGQPGQGRGQHGEGQGRGQPGQDRGPPGQGRGHKSQDHGRQGPGNEGRGQPSQGRGHEGQGRGQPGQVKGQPGQDNQPVTGGGYGSRPHSQSGSFSHENSSRRESIQSEDSQRLSSGTSRPETPKTAGDEYTKPKPEKPPSRITEDTNALAKQIEQSMVLRPSDKCRYKPPDRPDKGGKAGRAIVLLVNCFRMKIPPNKLIYMYDIKFLKSVEKKSNKDIGSRQTDNKAKRREIVNGFLIKQAAKFGDTSVYDGNACIFTIRLLPGISVEPRRIPYEHKDPAKDEDSDIVIHTLELKQVGTDCNTTDLLNYVDINGRGSTTDMPQEPIRAYDTLMRGIMQSRGMIPIGRRAFFESEPRNKDGLRCGPYVVHEGYFMSVRPQRWGVVLNIDKTQVALYKAQPMVQLISNLLGQRGDMKRDADRKRVEKAIKMLRVEANHFKSSSGKPYSRKFTIFGMSRESAGKEMIPDLRKSVAQYFKETYHINLTKPDWPCLKVAKDKKTFIPIECCTLLPYQPAPTKNAQIIQEVIRYAAIPAFQRRQNIENFMKEIYNDKVVRNFFNQWLINVNPNMSNITGRLLQPPKGDFGRQKQDLGGGSWRTNSFFKPYAKSVKWAIICLGRPGRSGEAPLFALQNEFPQAAQKFGIQFEPEPFYDQMEPSQLEKRFPDLVNKKFTLIFFVLNFDEQVYSTVKRCGDLWHGVVTQCIKYKNLENTRGLQQLWGNLLLKVNGKLGGINWKIDSLRADSHPNKPINEVSMIFGADVTHPSPTGSQRIRKSIAAVVGSLDPFMLEYETVVLQQASREGPESNQIKEIIEDLKDCVKILLLSFFRHNNGQKPVSLIFYRDGVSEGQFGKVLEHEMVAIQRACHELGGEDYRPGITFIVVQKRHNIRLFVDNARDGKGKSGNIPPGVVVDTDIVHPREFDFYLCSHEGIQGTSKAAHYHVLWDDNNWGSDDLQKFTFYLCHVYMRCARSVSYPAPTYYSHLAAFRARAWLGEDEGSDSGSVASGATGMSSTYSNITMEDIGTSKRIIINPEQNKRMYFL